MAKQKPLFLFSIPECRPLSTNVRGSANERNGKTKTALFVFPFPSAAYFRRMSEVVQIRDSNHRFLLPQ
ncbi:MAG: hypothetical protein IJT48_08255, partial [Bacteroidaceae bacterium]|nr:hypothetical protein [Bacteroidaceae bacterium]